jgi:predicted nucleic acid-binding protein
VIVVDSNIVAYLYMGGGYGPAAEALLEKDGEWAAPILWRSEFRNVLAGCLRRGDLDLEKVRAMQSEAEQFMREAEFDVDSRGVLDLIHESPCSAYDCEYVSLAMHLRTNLVTMDKQVLRAFPDVAVPLTIQAP